MSQNLHANEGHEPLEARQPDALSDRDWEEVARDETFRHLVAEKKGFIVPSTIVFLVYYFALIVFIGFFTFLNTKIFASVNWVHVFALSQFAMAWTIAVLYTRKANRFDQLAAVLRQRFLTRR